MKKVLRKNIIAIILPITLFGVSSCAMMGGIDNEGDTRRVDGVMWSNQVDTDIDDVLQKGWCSKKYAVIRHNHS
ncbi:MULTISPECIES: hypothetical protein [unclassified Psychrobacter]|uniref:hypothetical protein n=1 Tax=unclassified Psychrobacter TaxID=196806 RepID=UPI0025B4E494|nr:MULTISPECIES: hypothetical protein [unclassified Psychrobacter]MDN3454758.1 hypothetical protein [Psychrobacter sp. APC 3350]MDN3502998.1 hypothetical protein [Psychrobacter sp. 5A.1]